MISIPTIIPTRQDSFLALSLFSGTVRNKYPRNSSQGNPEAEDSAAGCFRINGKRIGLIVTSTKREVTTSRSGDSLQPLSFQDVQNEVKEFIRAIGDANAPAGSPCP